MSTPEHTFKVPHKASVVLHLTQNIEDLRAVQNQTAAIESDFLWMKDVVGFGTSPTDRWSLVICPTSPEKRPGDTDFTSVYVKLTTEDAAPAVVKGHVMFRAQVFPSKAWHLLGTGRDYEFAPNIPSGLHHAMTHRDLFNFPSIFVSADGVVSLRAELVFEIAPFLAFRYCAGLSRRQAVLYESREFADVVLISGDKKEFPVHSSILAAHSPVFRDMFRHELKEKQTRRVEIDDVDGETLDVLLRFVYSGSTAKVTEMAEEVLQAADKYNVPDLLELTVSHLCDNITVQNARRILVMADQRNLPKLSKAASASILENWESLRGTTEFIQVKKRDGALFALLEESGCVRKKPKNRCPSAAAD